MENNVAEIHVRPARSEDREAVLAFCEHTWEWGDYIEYVWDEWLADPAGLLLVAVYDGQPVGIVHTRMLSETDAWQEGMRVAPAYRRLGVARQLSLEASAEAMRRGATVVRLLTESTNVASIYLVEQSHFRRVGVFTPYAAAPITNVSRRNAGLDEPVLATLADLDEIIDYLNVSNIFPAVGGLYYLDYTAYRISDTLLQQKIQAGQVYLLRRWERLDGLAIAETRTRRNGDPYLFIGYIDGTTESISLVAYALRRKLPELGLAEARTNVPDLIMVRDAFAGAEYEADGSTYYTYERGLV